ncbi:MAG: RNA-binding S4 domain-containing protein [Flavobacteriales bacterium]|nr:RNA-binding S4 domain-containing protein [Flavobacteriales bacterium]MEB2341021.1 RNA-binding S4 domain-containing protein [Flavobacteriia bacterium]
MSRNPHPRNAKGRGTARTPKSGPPGPGRTRQGPGGEERRAARPAKPRPAADSARGKAPAGLGGPRPRKPAKPRHRPGDERMADTAARTRGPRQAGRPPGKDRRRWQEGDPGVRRPFRKGERSNRFSLPNPANEGLIRLNKYLAHAGVGSRREADELIAAGAVTVNGQVVTELGAKVRPDDIIHFGGQKLHMEQKRYVLLNKPKDTITTTDDPQERHTVMSLIANACSERLYPVGRLDRNTTGVLLLTNDGDLAKKLTHPSHGAQKLYHATLDRNLTGEELHRLVEGVMLEDGPAKADEASFVGASKREVGLLIHMGRNRIVRRMFQALGAEVVKLDRVMFAGLTKKDLSRGRWRHLEEKEVVWLKQLKAAPADTGAERGGRRTRLSQGSE